MKKAITLTIGSSRPVMQEKSKSQGNFMNRKKNVLLLTLLKSERKRYKLYNNGIVNHTPQQWSHRITMPFTVNLVG